VRKREEGRAGSATNSERADEKEVEGEMEDTEEEDEDEDDDEDDEEEEDDDEEEGGASDEEDVAARNLNSDAAAKMSWSSRRVCRT
jgi:hypothetical protein